MDWTWYLFRFDGRINRARLWLAILVIGCWMLFLAGLAAGVSALFGGPASFGFRGEDVFKIVDPAAYRSLSTADLPRLAVKTIGTALFAWVYAATSIKRLHDRDKSGWWMVPFFVVPGLYDQFGDRLPDSPADLPLALSAFALGLWGFVEMYFLKGSPKTNRFGANPLASKPARDTATRWDQQSEIDLVPHKAGPPPVWRVKRSG
jgi:uncharacterized membrane protein YhaH (DUF805 family)